MKLPSSFFAEGIQVGKVYYFSSEKISSPDPHFFICLGRDETDIVFMVCGTSQFKKREKFIKDRGLPYSTLVWIKPDQGNGLAIDTYVDCNRDPFQYPIQNLIDKYEQDALEYKGEVEDHILSQIKIGLIDSPLVSDHMKTVLEGVMRGW
jgi:hypothetical protein